MVVVVAVVMRLPAEHQTKSTGHTGYTKATEKPAVAGQAMTTATARVKPQPKQPGRRPGAQRRKTDMASVVVSAGGQANSQALSRQSSR